jgi:AcrR family transcriptional regulator
MLSSNISVVIKRERTRQRLLECGLDLFERQGFEATTVAQIAAAAGVTPMTFFRHFAAKENVLLDDPYDPVIAAAIAKQPHTLPTLLRVSRGIRTAWGQLPEPDSDLVRRRVRIAALTPTLRNAVGANSHQTERLIAEALVADGVAALPARAAAAAAMSAMTAALFEWATEPELTLAGAVGIVLDVLEGST